MTLYFIFKYLHVLGAIVILGTGTGIAFFMLMAHRSGDPAFIARTAATVVIADMLFTASAVLLQPVTGGLLMMLSVDRLRRSAGWRLRSGYTPWPGCSGFPLYSCRSKCAIWRAAADARGEPLPPRYFVLFRRWFLFGIPGFGSVMADSLADDRQAAILGGRYERSAKDSGARRLRPDRAVRHRRSARARF